MKFESFFKPFSEKVHFSKSVISQNSKENTCARTSLSLQLYFKKVFSCKFSEIAQNTFFTEHLWETASSFPQKNSIVEVG